MGLRELLDRQKAEAAAKAAAPAPAPKPTEVAPPPVAEKPALKGLAAMRAMAAQNKPPVTSGIERREVIMPPIPLIPPGMTITSSTVIPIIVPMQETEPPKDLGDPVLAEIKANIQFLSDHIEEGADLIGQVVRKIMDQIRKNPHFKSFLTGTDKENIVRGYRRAYQVAARKKTDGVEKKVKKSLAVDEIDSIMKDLDIGDIGF